MKRLRGKLTYANVVATFALFIALAGGTAFAATQMLPRNSVGTRQLKKEAVTPIKLSAAAKATLVGPRGATGATGAQGAKGDPGFQKSIEGTPNPLGTSTFGTTAVSLPVPAGTYLVTADMEFIASGANLALCRLIDGDGGAGFDSIVREQSLALGNAENSTISGLFTVTPGQEMEVQCSRADAGSTVDVDRITIVAAQVQEATVTN